MIDGVVYQTAWPVGKKILFRFFFIYLMLQIAPWTWLDALPGVTYVTGYYDSAVNWSVENFNRHIFQIKEQLVPLNGSGDTSFGWAAVCLFILVALIGSIIWSLIDQRRRSYDIADYWLRNFVRYFIAMHALGYGIIKIFALQMYFPNISQLATPLGDFLPMRLSWLFIGYSLPYQIFSGIMEAMAGVFLLNRKTVTLGLLMATGVFINVVLLNLSYDIPVKIFSMHLLFYCFYLLAYDTKRLVSFFVFNKPVSRNEMYDVSFLKKWSRLTRVGVKSLFIILFLLLPFYNSWKRVEAGGNITELKPIKPGLYDVKIFVLNGDTIPPLLTDTLRWRDVVFERDGGGSVNSVDTMFRQRYRRGYFVYKPDTATHTLNFKKRLVTNAEVPLFDLSYEVPSERTLKLWGKVKNDSLYVELIKSNRHFQLTERQFHWLSEYNR